MSKDAYIPREHYLSRIRESRGSDFIKVLTGIRRCGKSTLMGMFIDELKDSSIPDDRIFFVNLDDASMEMETFRDLIDAVESKVGDVEGIVDNVGVRSTRIRTFQKTICKSSKRLRLASV